MEAKIKEKTKEEQFISEALVLTKDRSIDVFRVRSLLEDLGVGIK